MRRCCPRSIKTCCPARSSITDAWQAYRGAQRDYTHFYIDHAVKYVEGHVTTNRIENFWSCLKRTLHGTYIAPRAFHLQAYVDEQVYRFNVRAQKDGARFVGGLKGADGRRLTYIALTTSHPLWRLKPGRSKASTRRVGSTALL